MSSPIPDFETLRLKELHDLQILDTPKEERFDRFINLVADIFQVPIVLFSLVDANRQWFKSFIGIEDVELPREVSFCAHVLSEKEIMIVSNALDDPRFSENPLVIGKPNIRFYAGAVLKGPTGLPLGALCIIDTTPRNFNKKESNRLVQFAHLLEHEMHFKHYLNKMQEKIEISFYYDTLTQLPNRRLFDEMLEQEIAKRKKQEKIIIFSIDLAQYHDVSNAFGQENANFLIKEMAERLKAIFKENRTISHLDNGHFLLFIKDKNSITIVNHLQHFQTISQRPFKMNHVDQILNYRIGVSVFPEDGSRYSDLIEHAISAMNNHKVSSGIQYQIYSNDLSNKLENQFEMVSLLQKAIEENTLEVFYQPKVNLKTGLICGAEALCRWNDSKHGPIPPSVFIPIAEHSDLIIKLGTNVLRKVCRQSIEWQSIGLPKIPISINLTTKEILKPTFVEDLQLILKEMEYEGEYLDLEITESSLIRNFKKTSKVIKELKKMGITISLDDFGTGYSSLSYLRRIRLQTLKIDKSFIDNIISNKRDEILVQAIIAISKALNYTTVAEGVETMEQLRILQSFGCDQIQGYVFSPPLPAERFGQIFLANKKLNVL